MRTEVGFQRSEFYEQLNRILNLIRKTDPKIIYR